MIFGKQACNRYPSDSCSLIIFFVCRILTFLEKAGTWFGRPLKILEWLLQWVIQDTILTNNNKSYDPVFGSASTTRIHQGRKFKGPMGRSTHAFSVYFHDGSIWQDREQGHGSASRRWASPRACMLVEILSIAYKFERWRSSKKVCSIQ